MTAEPNLIFSFADYHRVVITRYDNSPEHQVKVGEFWRIELPFSETWQLRYADPNKAWPLPGVIRKAFNEFLESYQTTQERQTDD